MPATYNWKSACIIRETADTVTIVFNTGNDKFQFQPGQFVNLSLNIKGTTVTRPYSLSSAADEDEKPAITVKKVKDGLMSGYIVNHAEEIKEWQVDGPHGFFYPSEKSKEAWHIVLIGGGSGITPLYSILKYFLKQTTATIILVNANRTKQDILFGKALSYLEYSFSHRFIQWHIFSQEKQEDNAADERQVIGRLSKLTLKKILKKELPEDIEKSFYFMCGPPGLIQLAEDTLTALNISDANRFKEYFIPPEHETKEVVLPGSMQEVLFHHYEQINLLEVQPGKTILEAALEDGMPVNYSCKSGTCGICVGKLTTGKVYMAKNFALREEQLADGYILLCQSHPVDNAVTIKVEELT